MWSAKVCKVIAAYCIFKLLKKKVGNPLKKKGFLFIKVIDLSDRYRLDNLLPQRVLDNLGNSMSYIKFLDNALKL